MACNVTQRVTLCKSKSKTKTKQKQKQKQKKEKTFLSMKKKSVKYQN